MNADYGLWPLVLINTAIVVIFAASFFHPKTSHDWKAFGGFTAFMIALFTEMYGAPFTLYLLSGWVGSRFPALTPTHASGHLWNDLINWQGDPHLSPFHFASYGLIGAGFWLLATSWRHLFAAARASKLATEGPYARIRHPQYVGFWIIMLGFLLQWPTIPTLLMFPVLVVVYRRLAMSEERQVDIAFGNTWRQYAARTPAFVPRWWGTPSASESKRR